MQHACIIDSQKMVKKQQQQQQKEHPTKGGAWETAAGHRHTKKEALSVKWGRTVTMISLSTFSKDNLSSDSYPKRSPLATLNLEKVPGSFQNQAQASWKWPIFTKKMSHRDTEHDVTDTEHG